MTVKAPNILFVFGDQWRADVLGCAGNPDVRTPNIDRLAAQGVRCTQAISNCPLCVPARASMLTGRYPLAHGAVSNDMPLPPGQPTLATVLRDHGYSTGYIGKWHLDGVPRDKFTPPGERRCGFDFWAAWECHHNYFHGRYHADTPEVHTIEGYEPFGQTEIAIDYMRDHADNPFCLWLSWGPPHNPYDQVPEEYRALYDPSSLSLRPNCKHVEGRDLADYYAQCTALDFCVGRLSQALDELGIADDTIAVFTSDHGDMLGSHGRLRKEQPWEESIGIPFIVRWPRSLPSGVECRSLVSLVDMAPTLLGLVGLPVPDTMDGVDLSARLSGEPGPEPDSVFLCLPLPGGEGLRNGVPEWRGVRTRTHTYARLVDGRPWVLYDNERDPYQLDNLTEDPDAAVVREELERELQRWLAATGDDFLPGLDHVRQLGLADAWNESERVMERRNPRWA